jgi:hypothetical protein
VTLSLIRNSQVSDSVLLGVARVVTLSLIGNSQVVALSLTESSQVSDS